MPTSPTFAAWKLPPPIEEPPLLDADYLRKRAAWIRDELDPLVARDGPDALRTDSLAILFNFFEQLRTSQLTIESVRISRINYALLEIAGRATRWPSTLIDKAEDIIKKWEADWGSISEIRATLYGPGGRLHGVSTPEDISSEALLIKWMRRSNSRVIPTFARRHGDLGFKPGDWWINSMFAFHDGIIESGSASGGVTACSQEAYALLLTHDDEFDSPDPDHFTYRSRVEDNRRYRLTAGTPISRQPVRVLRSHTLRSFWSPRAGIRYDGLYKVSGWRVTQDPKTHAIVYNIFFARLPSEPPLLPILGRPKAEELDDYQEYKRIRKEVRSNRNPLRHGTPFGPLGRMVEPVIDGPITTKKQRKRSSLHLGQLAPAPIPSTTIKDVNPFFSGALDDKSTSGISMVRSEIIDFAPMVSAASAAGANIDPFLADIIDQQAAKKRGELRPETGVLSAPILNTVAAYSPFPSNETRCVSLPHQRAKN